MPRHGIVRKKEFKLGIKYTLEDKKITTRYIIENKNKETCTVPTPVTETGLIDMEHRREFLKDTDTLQLKHDLFSVDAVILDQLKSRAVTLTNNYRPNQNSITSKSSGT